MTSNKTYKAFVSSTFIDLKDHRAHVINSLRNAGFCVDPMENWTADSDEPKKFSQERLNGCGLYVLLVAFRRGFVPDGETLSITQMEYEAALQVGAEVLVYQLDENAKWWAKYDEREKDPALNEWRSHLGKKHGTEFFTDDPRSIDMTGALGRWLTKKRGLPSEGLATLRIDWPEGKSPYRGLQWFNQEYAPLFFGRDREVDDLVAKMSEPGGRVVLVIGASGSGKSSVVAAGVWQAVTKQGRLSGSTRWLWQRIQPSDGNSPSDAVARGLKDTFQLAARPKVTDTGELRDLLSRHLNEGEELILFVDQFEELFTSSFKELDIQSFLELLFSTAKEPMNRFRIVATIRSEFLGKLEAYDSTLNLLNSPYRYHLGPVSPRMLQAMIEKPAEATGYDFESGLVDRILMDSGQEPGNLPLVAYALKQLFEQRKGRSFTVEAYEAMGGVVGAIATRAHEVLSALPEAVQGEFDAVFAELVHVERERPPTRTRACFSTFSSNPAAVELIVALAGQDCRVLVTSRSGQETIVEVAHERLFSAWPKLKDWIEKSTGGLLTSNYIEEGARRWHETGCHLQELWQKERADDVQQLLTRFRKIPSPWLETMLHPQGILIERLHVMSLSHQDRLLVGQKLVEFGDTRPGVGVKDGLPDIAWIKIPGGKVNLEGVDRVFKVKPFSMANYPVTNQQFQVFLKSADGYRNKEWWKDLEQHREAARPRWQEANCPRETVSWYEAVAFCRWLSAKTETGLRLPTEWEWQQAATGGDPTREYPWGKEWDGSRCNSDESRPSRTTAVGLYPAGGTRQGVLDMAGNVWEWCLNEYDNPEQPKAMQVNKKGGRRVVRGGSWFSVPGDLRASFRFGDAPSHRLGAIGFRLVQDIL